MIAKVIYVLCALTSLFCFAMLFRGYLRHRTGILLSSSVAFLAFAAANVLLVVDLLLLPDVDLLILRNAVTLLGVVLLVWGLIANT